MSKYVRTEDGRIIDFSGATSVQIHAFRSHYKFVKQADTIEELCDEFVEVGKHTNIPRYSWNCFDYQHDYGKEWHIEIMEKLKTRMPNLPTSYIYGAIWTDKGLIYVAKMNEKGELELI